MLHFFGGVTKLRSLSHSLCFHDATPLLNLIVEVRAQLYECVTHRYRYNLPVGSSTKGCTLVGDVLGHWIVKGDLWQLLWNTFQDQESFAALEKLLRNLTENSMVQCIQRHALTKALTDEERSQLHLAMLHHCLATPDWQTLKSWLHTYAQNILMPLIPSMAQHVVSAFGSFVNIDFSSSDAKQLLPKKANKKRKAIQDVHAELPADSGRSLVRVKGKVWAGAVRAVHKTSRPPKKQAPKQKRTWGAATGLSDVPLLPALFTQVEDNAAKQLILQVCLRRARCQIQGFFVRLF